MLSRDSIKDSIQLIILLLSLVMATHVGAARVHLLAGPDEPSPSDGHEKQIRDLMAAGRVPGLSVAVIRNGEIAWHGAFGVRNAETNDVVDDVTIFEAASLTKPLFAYAVLQLVAEGVLDLDRHERDL